jgi:RHS repeat-associated protein
LLAGAGITLYLNGDDSQGLSYEKEIKANGVTEHKHYLSAGGMVFAMQVTRNLSLLAGANPATANTSLASLRYMHHDHLGSIAAVTSDTGAVLERLAFDPWGKRRNVNGQADTTDSLVGQTTDRGYTEHEHLDEMGLIHMNGRVYDPLVGRMMSADPFIQAPGSLQSYNRYSYVMKNPLNLTDPSGYRSFLQKLMHLGDRISSIGVSLGSPKLYHASVNFLSGSGGYQLKSAALGYVSLYCGAWVAACNGGFQAALAKGYGASDNDAFKAGAIAAVSTGAFQLAGGVGNQYSFERYLAHAGAGCVSAVAGGGNCGKGAVAGVFGKFASNELSISGSGIQYDIANGVIAVTAGGIGSVIAGGKFENGAVTAAYGYLFNQLSPKMRDYARGNGWIDADGKPMPYDANAVKKDIAAISDAGGMVASLATAACVAAAPCAAGAVTGGVIVGTGMSLINSADNASPSSSIIDYLVDFAAALVPNSLRFFSQIGVEVVKKTDTVDNVKKQIDETIKR